MKEIIVLSASYSYLFYFNKMIGPYSGITGEPLS